MLQLRFCGSGGRDPCVNSVALPAPLFCRHAMVPAFSGVGHPHLHVFSRALFAGIIADKLKITDRSAIPTIMLPVKYTARPKKLYYST